MGLVTAPPLSVLPVAVSSDSATPVSQSAATTDRTVTDSFAALLAMLGQGAATVTVPPTSLTGGSTVPPGGTSAGAKADDDTSRDSSLAAALAAAMLLSLPVAASSVSEPAAGANGATGTASATPTGLAAAAPLTASLLTVLPGAASDAPTPSGTTDTTASLPSVAPDANTDTPALPAATDTIASLPSVAPATSTDIPTSPAAPGQAASPDANAGIAAILRTAPESSAVTPSAQPARPSEAPIPPVALDVGGATKPPAAAQPPGTVVPQGIVVSVVRSVGNAQQSQTTGDGAHDGASSGQKQEASSTPVAQALNSAAAVAGPLVATSPAAVAQVPQSSAPAHVTPEPVAQVARAVIDRAERGGGEVHIRLDPPELGAVTIHVRIDGDRVQVQVQAERHDAMNLLRQNTLDLSTLLGSRGLNLTDVNVGLGGRQAQGGDQSSANPAPGSTNGEFASILGIDEAPATELHNRLQSAYNPDGLHIYRV